MFHGVWRQALILSLILLATTGSLARAAAGTTTRCESRRTPVKYELCITRAAGSTNPDLVYYFHESGARARSWSENYGALYGAWSRSGKEPPAVISISFGARWLLAFEPPMGRSLATQLVERILPELEGGLGGLKGDRLLVGRSLGGFNAAFLALKHPGLFKRVALLSPALLSISPHAPLWTVYAFLKRTRAQTPRVLALTRVFALLFPTERSWTDASPLALANQSDLTHAPAFYVSCGTQDEYGFFEGARNLVTTLQRRGSAAEWQALSARHWAMDFEALAGFLVP